jgi:hypothetical protein
MEPVTPLEVAEPSLLLQKLTPTLIITVSNLLPPESISAFALCCRKLYHILGIPILKKFDRYKILMLLERQLPNHIVCYFCKKLHAIRHPHRYIPSYIEDYEYVPNRGHHWECLDGRARPDGGYDMECDFSYPLIQMVMKRYRQGGNYSSILSLLATSYADSYRDGSEQYTLVPRIVNGSFLIRQQERLLTPPTHSLPSCPLFHVCPHINLSDEYTQDPDWNQSGVNWARRMNLLDPRNWQQIIKCRYCFTEFRIDFKRFKEGDSVMVFKKWQNLGERLTPLDDDRWASHLRCDPWKWQEVEFERGSICSGFEQREYFMFEPDGIELCRSL